MIENTPHDSRELSEKLELANFVYHSGMSDPLMSDDQFDDLVAELGRIDPNHPLVTGEKIGTLPDRTDRRMRTLVYPMGSLDKVKPTDADARKRLCKMMGSVKNEPYVITDKLDGISAMLLVCSSSSDTNINRIKKRDTIKERCCRLRMFTRGDGKTGQDISHAVPYLRNIPPLSRFSSLIADQSFGRDDRENKCEKNKTTRNNATGSKTHHGANILTAIRGELVIPRERFEKRFGKPSDAGSRNVVAGAVNALKTDSDILSLIDFVPYSVYEPYFPSDAVQDQLRYIRECAGFSADYVRRPYSNSKLSGYHHVYHETHDNLDMDTLCRILQKRKTESMYSIDGIVVSNTFAFKNRSDDNVADTRVKRVAWAVSKDGFLKPTIEFDPVRLSGAILQKATAFNADFVSRNRLGPGALVRVTRSGDVIPHVIKVLEPAADGDAQMPSSLSKEEWKWNGRDAELIDKGCVTEGPGGDVKPKSDIIVELEIKRLAHFVNKMGAFGVSEGIVNKLYRAGFVTPGMLAHVGEEDLVRVPGFKRASAKNVSEALRKALTTPDCVLLMEASSVFGRGFGERRLRSILNAYPGVFVTTSSHAGKENDTAHNNKSQTNKKKIDTSLATVSPPRQALPDERELAETVSGISVTTARAFLEGLHRFHTFVNDNGMSCTLPAISSLDDGRRPLSKDNESGNGTERERGLAVVFSGFRDKDLEAHIRRMGGRVVSSVSKNVNYLLIPDERTDEVGTITTKVNKARLVGVPIVSVSEFLKREKDVNGSSKPGMANYIS